MPATAAMPQGKGGGKRRISLAPFSGDPLNWFPQRRHRKIPTYILVATHAASHRGRGGPARDLGEDPMKIQ
jgi:hypothetical protein